jgi:hypothetical protein
MERRTDGYMDGETDGQTEGRTSGLIDWSTGKETDTSLVRNDVSLFNELRKNAFRSAAVRLKVSAPI